MVDMLDLRYLLVMMLVGLANMSIVGQQSGLYYGAAATLQEAETALNRTVEEQVDHVDVPDTRLTTTTNATDKPLQWDALVGYRVNIADETQFLSIQAEVSLIGDDVNRNIDEFEATPGQRLFGEAWPKDWQIETSRSIGVITKYGINRKFLKVMDMSFYGLLGVRQTRLDFFTSFLGCFQTAGCSVDQLRTESVQVDPELNMIVTGVGFETNLGLKTALQVEVRAVSEASSEWESKVTSEEQELVTPYTLEQSGTDLSMKLIRYF